MCVCIAQYMSIQKLKVPVLQRKMLSAGLINKGQSNAKVRNAKIMLLSNKKN